MGGVLRMIVVVTLCAGCAGYDLFNTQFDDVEEAPTFEAATLSVAPAEVGALTVMTWNAKFAGGRIDFFFECRGDRVLMSEEEVLGNLAGLAAYIRELDPDILLLQEVDLKSKRSTYINMVQRLLDSTDLNYGAYASVWKADFIPSDGLGKMESGIAVLSRWPLHESERIGLPLVGEFDDLKTYFYLKRAMLRTRVAVPGRDDFYVLNVHTEAFSHDGTRKRQIDLFRAELDRLHADGKLVIGGGDLNTVPPQTLHDNDFDDSACTDEEFDADDFSEEGDTLSPFYAADSVWTAAIPLAEYTAGDQTPFFTHTTDANGFWNRKLDYLYTNMAAADGRTHQDTMPLSDHAPLSVVVTLP